jgi:hypothetical protein
MPDKYWCKLQAMPAGPPTYDQTMAQGAGGFVVSIFFNLTLIFKVTWWNSNETFGVKSEINFVLNTLC